MITTTNLVIIAVTVLVSLMCFKDRTLFYKLSLNPYDIVHRKQWYRIVTHGFVHGDTMHLLINMLVLWSFGTNIELRLQYLAAEGYIGNAAVNYSILYLGALIFASIPNVYKYKDNVYYNSIGASGAVSAVVFASIFFDPWSNIYFMAILPVPSIIFGGLYIWYSQYMDRRGGGNINHRAHIWGAVFGLFFPVIMEPGLIYHFIHSLVRLPF